MDVDILKKFIPDEYTLKCKSSIDELIISAHCMKMMSMQCEVSVYVIIFSAPNDTANSSCCANCVEPPRPHQWGPDLPFFGHADPLDGWRCSLQKRVMSRPIQVRQL